MINRLISTVKLIINLHYIWADFVNDTTTRLVLSIKNLAKVVNVNLGAKGRFHQITVFYGLGKICIGNNFSFGYRFGGGYSGARCELQARTLESIIMIGEDIATSNGVMICAAEKIVIGNKCLIGQDVIIIDHDAHGMLPIERRTSIGNIRPIEIGDNVWIGSKAIILPGTQIGHNSVVGAGAVVKGKFQENSVVVGNPARAIRII